jgi:hypothetical protein
MARDAVPDTLLDRWLKREELRGLVTAIQARQVEFNNRVRADFPVSLYERSLPRAFAVGDVEAAVRETLRTMEKLWGKINAIAVPPAGITLQLVLQGGYTLAQFTAARGALRVVSDNLGDLDVDLRLARETRNDQQDVIYDALKNYRLKVPAMFPADHALVETLPLLNVPDGHTPEAVTVTATWNAATNQAELNWDASTDADLKHYAVEGVAGEEYITEDGALLSLVLPGAPRTYPTNFSLGSPRFGRRLQGLVRSPARQRARLRNTPKLTWGEGWSHLACPQLIPNVKH